MTEEIRDHISEALLALGVVSKLCPEDCRSLSWAADKAVEALDQALEWVNDELERELL